jgi:hypothetical protein
MSYRNDVDALAARHAALEAEVAEIAKQRDDAKRLLEDARERAKLPVLDNLRVASPCSEKWADMAGDERVRACAKCNQNVYNLSSLARAEAETLIAERNGRMCVRYFQRADGTILLADCTVGKRNKRYRRAIAVGVAASLAGGVAGYTTHTRHHHDEEEEVAGKMTMGDIGPMPRMGELAITEPTPEPTEALEAPHHVSMRLPR